MLRDIDLPQGPRAVRVLTFEYSVTLVPAHVCTPTEAVSEQTGCEAVSEQISCEAQPGYQHGKNHPLSPLHEPLHWRAKRDPKA